MYQFQTKSIHKNHNLKHYHGSKILVIEDNNDVRENIEELLQLSGYKVFTAENGKVGTAKALEEIPI
jgi:CheY-like chemotaxis protein